MKKGYIIVDIPDNPNPDDGCSNCKGCPFVSGRDQSGWRTCDAPGYVFNFGEKPQCPIKPFPEELERKYTNDCNDDEMLGKIKL